MNDGVCIGGDCAAVCPVFNLGGKCMTPAEFYSWLKENQSLASADTLVH